MPVTEVYHLHGIQNNTTFISQIESYGFSDGKNVIVRTSAGMPWPQFVGSNGTLPSASFDTTQIKTILDTTGGYAVNWSAANTDMLLKKAEKYATREGDAEEVHLRLRAADAMLFCQSITANSDSDATASCMMYFPFDGSNAPIIPAGSVALSGTPTHAEKFTLGPVEIDGTSIDGLLSASVSFNHTVRRRRSSGETYDTHISLVESRPTISLTCLTEALLDYGLAGASASSIELWFRKLGITGAVANATAQHIKATAAIGNLVCAPDMSAGGNDDATSTIMIYPIGDEDTAPISFNTAIAIS